MLHNQNLYMYSRERRRFGRQCRFGDRTSYLFSIQPSARMRRPYVLRNPTTTGTQQSVQRAESAVLTNNVALVSRGMLHYEGGWPREVNINDEESILRHRKKVEREENWGHQVSSLITKSSVMAEQNAAINVYEEYFSNIPPDDGVKAREKEFEARSMNLFRDLVKLAPRPAMSVAWSPSTPNWLLVQHTNLVNIAPPEEVAPTTTTTTTKKLPKGEILNSDNGQPQYQGPRRVCRYSFYLWDIANAIKPVAIFDCHDDVHKTAICPKNEKLLAGGFKKGNVAVWRTNKTAHPFKKTPLETSHRETCAALCWVHSKSNTEFYTGDIDGEIKFWDYRRLRKPLQTLLVDPVPTDDQLRIRALGVSCMEFEYTIPVRFMVCTMFGHVFLGNRKGQTPTETFVGNYRLFIGPIRTIERNPHFVKMFLITGDWSAKIWSEENKQCPVTLIFRHKTQVTCGTWSPARGSIFVTAEMNGELHFWDLLMDHRKPLFVQTYHSPIMSAKFRGDGKYLAIGFETGDIEILEMDPLLTKITSREKTLLSSLFERELHRSKLLEQRREEMALKMKTSVWEGAEHVKDSLADYLYTNTHTYANAEEFLASLNKDTEFKEAVEYFHRTVNSIEATRQKRVRVLETTAFELEPEELRDLYVDVRYSTRNDYNIHIPSHYKYSI